MKHIFVTRFSNISPWNFPACPQGVTGKNWEHDSYKYVNGIANRTCLAQSDSVGLLGFWENHHLSIILAPKLDILCQDVPKSMSLWSFFKKVLSSNYNLDWIFLFRMIKSFPTNLKLQNLWFRFYYLLWPLCVAEKQWHFLPY